MFACMCVLLCVLLCVMRIIMKVLASKWRLDACRINVFVCLHYPCVHVYADVYAYVCVCVCVEKQGVPLKTM